MDLTPTYDVFLHLLTQSLPTHSPIDFEPIDAALGVLRASGRTGYDVRGALEILVDNVTKEFGFAPRDVYRGVFNFTHTSNIHNASLEELDYRKLQDIVRAFYRGDLLLEKPSHRVVMVYPRESHFSHESWGIAFKSTLIARRVMELMKSEELKNLRDPTTTSVGPQEPPVWRDGSLGRWPIACSFTAGRNPYH